ncbi:MAG: hypothetical protein MPJ24_10820, partial [Pirellulaceae bacterium]|nr:hypothetical protein [Pirellulaceae bacterium]
QELLYLLNTQLEDADSKSFREDNSSDKKRNKTKKTCKKLTLPDRPRRPCQFIFTSRKPIGSDNFLKTALTSRLASGVVFSVKLLGPEARLAVARKLCRKGLVHYTPSLEKYLLRQSQISALSIWELVLKLKAMALESRHSQGTIFSGGASSSSGRPEKTEGSSDTSKLAINLEDSLRQVSLSSAKGGYLGEEISRQRGGSAGATRKPEGQEGIKNEVAKIDKFLRNDPLLPNITIDQIGRLLAKRVRLPITQIKGKTRKQSVVATRGLIIFLARELTNLSFEKIGKYLGGRDHSTILHSFEKTRKLAQTDPVTENQLHDIRELLGVSSPAETVS